MRHWHILTAAVILFLCVIYQRGTDAQAPPRDNMQKADAQNAPLKVDVQNPSLKVDIQNASTLKVAVQNPWLSVTATPARVKWQCKVREGVIEGPLATAASSLENQLNNRGDDGKWELVQIYLSVTPADMTSGTVPPCHYLAVFKRPVPE